MQNYTKHLQHDTEDMQHVRTYVQSMHLLAFMFTNATRIYLMTLERSVTRDYSQSIY